ncbi:4'-phosphopantetheinyl transferase family protein [Streptomyces sp. NPDC052773]|uniref:4'-phosphopantetheinyl transferase family protein n=1 Tax=Streptomyces sp. NPDC052773 TaxID=3365693 RepID=UPI0037D3EF13
MADAPLLVGPVRPGERRAGRAVREAVRRHGYAVCHGRVADWARAAGPAPDVAGLLGADLPRYRAAREPAVRERLVGSRVLLRWAVAAAGGTAPERVRLGRDGRGRPVVRAPSGLDAGLAHTADTLVVGVACGRLIGVDVEARNRSLLTLAGKICHPAELAELRGLPPGERNARLLRLWTLKEAYTKALGVGLARDFTSLHTELLGADWWLGCGEAAGGLLVAVAVGPDGPGR